ncbi:hypothetical protein CPB84DRAFT_1794139 [Gymnopilus junonius]|uniref:Uncharacterized protein n=1 Tax=Gymnopilus junonius TaxID=109634 RepID=A0A9P5NE72_GYMJU|nr:hypothetical protein CPB84DRAFT_1794139 [Gymnopilus junonius]
MSTFVTIDPNRIVSPAPSNYRSHLLKAPPPTRINSPPPALNLNNIDLSSDFGRNENEREPVSKQNGKDRDLLWTPKITITPPFYSSTSIPLVVISPPESNHGSPIVSPIISPSSTSAPSFLPPLPFSEEDFESIADLDTSSDSSASLISSSNHLSETWHPRSQDASHLDQAAANKDESGGGTTSGSCYSLESALRSGDDHADDLVPSRKDNQEKGGCQGKGKDKSAKGLSLVERLTRMFGAGTKRG